MGAVHHKILFILRRRPSGTEDASATFRSLLNVLVAPGTPEIVHNWILKTILRSVRRSTGGRRLRSSGSRGRLSSLARRIVHQVLQFFARLEIWNSLRGHFHPSPRLGIPPHARLPLPGAKTTKPPDLALIPIAHRTNDAVENGFYDHLGILPGHFHDPGDFLDQLGLRHV